MSGHLSAVIPESLEASVRAVLGAASDAKLTLATAESCTGGLLASLLTDIENLSHAFERGFVVYTDAAKHDLLGVPTELLAREGAVSAPVAVAMAEGAIDRSRADVAVAITGFAGPAGRGDEEGLVHVACARRGRATARREAHFGPRGRGAVRIAAVTVALAMLAEAIR
jgi:nicotinamide-nucleotide amidase